MKRTNHFILPLVALLGLIGCSNPTPIYMSEDLKNDGLFGNVKSIHTYTRLVAEENPWYLDMTEYQKEYNTKGQITHFTTKEFGETQGVSYNKSAQRKDYYYDGKLSASCVYNILHPDNVEQIEYTEYFYDEKGLLSYELSQSLVERGSRRAIQDRRKNYEYDENNRVILEDDNQYYLMRDVTVYEYPEPLTTSSQSLGFTWSAFPRVELKEEDLSTLRRVADKKIIKHLDDGRIISIQRGSNDEICTVDYGKNLAPTLIKNGVVDVFNQPIYLSLSDEYPEGVKYVYEFDKHKNWIKRTDYSNKDNKALYITERDIEYYEDQ